MVIVMKKVFMAMFLLLTLALLLAGCAEKQETETGTVQLSPLLLEQPAEYYQGGTVQEINAAMFVYDCYYLGENDWLAYASVGLAQGSDRLLFRLKDGAARLVYQQMTSGCFIPHICHSMANARYILRLSSNLCFMTCSRAMLSR